MSLKKFLKSMLKPLIAWLFGKAQYISEEMAKKKSNNILSLGEYTYGLPKVISLAGDHNVVKIGKYCSISDGTEVFVGGNHNPQWITTYPIRIMLDLPGKYQDGQPSSKGDVVIGNDVWIGRDCMILSGCSIGDGAVVAARSVVTKDVLPYSIVAGNPARLVRYRFSEEQISALLQIRWWDLDVKDVINNVNLLCSANIDDFIKEFKNYHTTNS